MVGITLAKELIFTGGILEKTVTSLSFSEGFVYHTLSLSVCLLSGRRVGGQTALEMGLVNRAVEQNQTGDAAYREALSLAREILPQVRIQTHFLLSATAQILMHPSSSSRQQSALPPCFSSAYLSPLFILPFSLSFPGLSFPPSPSPLFLSLQASVAPYFFHSVSDAHSWRGQSGSQVEKRTTNSTTQTRAHTHINRHMLVLVRIE